MPRSVAHACKRVHKRKPQASVLASLVPKRRDEKELEKTRAQEKDLSTDTFWNLLDAMRDCADRKDRITAELLQSYVFLCPNFAV